MKLLSRSMLVFAASMCIASSALAQSAKNAIQISNLTLIDPTASTPGRG
jgi:hypothetical protein